MVEQILIQDFMWDSIKETFETMIFLPIEKTEEPGGESDHTSLICTITFTGPLQGSFSMMGALPTVEKIARAMLMLEADDPMEDADTSDAFGEVVNIVLGGIKAKLNDIAPDIQISIPSSTKGKEIGPLQGKDTVRADLVTRLENEPIHLAMVYKANS